MIMAGWVCRRDHADRRRNHRALRATGRRAGSRVPPVTACRDRLSPARAGWNSASRSNARSPRGRAPCCGEDSLAAPAGSFSALSFSSSPRRRFSSASGIGFMTHLRFFRSDNADVLESVPMSETGPTALRVTLAGPIQKANRREAKMRIGRPKPGSLALLCIALLAATPAAAQKKGGTLRLYHNDNPPSTSLHEEIDHRLGDAVFGRVQQPRDVRSVQGP